MTARLHAIASRFSGGQEILAIMPLGNGLINDSYRVRAESTPFVLQRINIHVFPQPERMMANLQRLGRHIRQQSAVARLKIPAIIMTDDRQMLHQDEGGCFWRALELIHPAESREQLSCYAEAEQVGFALAHFHRLCSTLPTAQLYDTLPGFHITPDYFQHYQSLIRQPVKFKESAQSRYCREFIENFQGNIAILEQAKQQGRLTERVMHGDPKLNNFLFQPDSNRIVSLIDLDTVKPGLVHYDIGDCLRSCCHLLDGDRFDLDRCRMILTAYLREAGNFFTSDDYEYLYYAILLIPFELGLRFFSDYLAGNCYFKVNDDEQNLRRCAALFRLCEDIALQRVEIEGVVLGLRQECELIKSIVR